MKKNEVNRPYFSDVLFCYFLLFLFVSLREGGEDTALLHVFRNLCVRVCVCVGGSEPKSEVRGGGGERTNRGIQHAHRSEAINRRGLLCPSPPPLPLLVLARRQHQKLSSKAGVVHPFGRRMSFGVDLVHASHRVVVILLPSRVR